MQTNIIVKEIVVAFFVPILSLIVPTYGGANAMKVVGIIKAKATNNRSKSNLFCKYSVKTEKTALEKILTVRLNVDIFNLSDDNKNFV